MPLTKVTYSMIQGDVLNVLDYGAVGDNLTDNSAAFNAAINALPASGGTIFIPSGVYKLNITITKPNIIFQGDGPATTTLFNNTTTPGTYCLDFDLPNPGSSVSPFSVSVRDLSIDGGNWTNDYHGIRTNYCIQGYFKNIFLKNVGEALFIENTYNTSFENFFVRDFGKGIVSGASAANNNNFSTWYFFGGNSSNTAQPLYDNTGLMGQNTFTDIIFEGSGQQTYSVFNGNGNTFVGCRWESCTPTTAETYIKIGGNNNRFINPLFTCGVETEVLTDGYFVQINGFNNEIDTMQETGVAKRLVYFGQTSKFNSVKLNTYNCPNQTLTGALYLDLGSNNLVNLNDEDFTYNNEVTWSNNLVYNYFPQSTDMSSITTDGLTQALLGGAAGRAGPFREGLIQTFTSPTGNRRWYVDILPLYGSAPITIQDLFTFSFWAKSLTSGGETITVFNGRTVGANTASVYIPDNQYVRVIVPVNTDNSSTYSNLYVGIQLPVSSSGVNIYGCQVHDCGSRGATYPAMIAGGYIPTASAASFEIAPNYSRLKKQKVSPANASATVGAYVQNLVPAVGQPSGWYCSVSGSPATWIPTANL